MASPLVRADLTRPELEALRRKAQQTGISMARLVGDAIRATVLKGEKA